MPTTTVNIAPDTQGFDAALAAIAKSLDDFANGPVTNSAKQIESAMTGSFDAIAGTIARAVASGKLSMDSLVNSILADFDRIAIKDFIAKPIESVIASLASSVFSIGGARASGGAVDAGLAYLVGEQGPELFVPQSAGAIVPNGAVAGAARPQIVMNVQARDAGSFLKSETQIAAMLSRALARGQRNL